MAPTAAIRPVRMMAILLVSGVTALPSMFADSLAAQHLAKKAANRGDRACPFAELKKRQTQIPFNPVTQYISTSGTHAFVPPGPTDLRGNCPGLNVLANHGYLPHSGYASLQQYIDAVNHVFGMSPDLGSFLSAFGTLTAGDPLHIPPSWSMGGRPTDTQVGLDVIGTALIPRGRGIDNSHNVYEGDASVSRGDYWQFNRDSSSLQLRFFKDLYNRKTTDPNFRSYDTPTLMAHCSARNTQSTNENPNFFTGNFAGFVAAKAAYFFTSRLMANFSAENNIDGTLTPSILKSFFAVSGPDDDNLTWTRGWERIPDNWYRRPNGYGQVGVFTDIATMISLYPNTGRIGGNTGTPNSFVGVDTANLTGGVYNSASLTDPTKLNCFALQLAQVSAVDFLSAQGLVGGTLGTLYNNILGPLVTSRLTELACPSLPGIKNALFDQFPGYGAPDQP